MIKGEFKMKLLLKAVCCGMVISCLLSLTGFSGVCNDLEDKIFRLHILANSDSEADQNLKLKVRDEITRYTEELFADCKSKEESMKIAEENIQSIINHAQNIIHKNGYNYSVGAYVTNMSFDTRVYDEFTLPAGKYDALRIVIGSGEGHNWWCVLYPAVCVPSAEQKINSVLNDEENNIVTESDKYTVKFKFAEIFENICSWFGA